MRNVLREMHYAFRLLRRSPGFTAVAVATLALGIGANTLIFTLLYSVVLRPINYPAPDRLVSLFLTMPTPGGSENVVWSYPKYEEFRREARSYESITAFAGRDFNLNDEGDPERIAGEAVSASYFATLGITPARGRVFSADEDSAPGRGFVAVISDGLWRRRYGADAGILGKSVRLNQTPVTIIGVMPEGVKGESGKADVWVPMTSYPIINGYPPMLTNRNAHWHYAVGRLKPGVSVAQAQAEIAQIVGRTEKERPSGVLGKAAAPWSAGVKLLADDKVDPSMRYALLVLFAAVGCVLLIACLNLANILLSRAVQRRREVAIRISLGATQMSLVRQFLIESAILSLIGGLAGLLVAVWGLELLRLLQPQAASGHFWTAYTRAIDPAALRLQAPVVAFNVALSLLTAVIFGLLPAVRSSRLNVNETLKNSDARAGGSGQWNARRVLVVGQVAVAVVLLSGAGLMIRSFARLLHTDLGARTTRILSFRLDLPGKKYEPAAAARFKQELLGRIRALPGVELAAANDSLPAGGLSSITVMGLDGAPMEELIGMHEATGDFFRLFAVPLLRGRLVGDADTVGTRHVAVINETAAKRLFPGGDPLGHRITLGIEGFDKNEGAAEIVGVVGDVRYMGYARPEMDAYVSALQDPGTLAYGWVTVRAARDPSALVAAIRAEVKSLDREVPMFDVKTMDETIAAATSRERFSTVLLGLFAALALVLAAIGIYGLISYSVTSRLREIGIRIALGARAYDVLRMVLADGLLLAGAGLAAGIPLALAATRVLRSMLYEIQPHDAPTFVAVCLVLAALAALACYLPARRAMRVDPIVVLRYE